MKKFHNPPIRSLFSALYKRNPINPVSERSPLCPADFPKTTSFVLSNPFTASVSAGSTGGRMRKTSPVKSSSMSSRDWRNTISVRSTRGSGGSRTTGMRVSVPAGKRRRTMSSGRIPRRFSPGIMRRSTVMRRRGTVKRCSAFCIRCPPRTGRLPWITTSAEKVSGRLRKPADFRKQRSNGG